MKYLPDSALAPFSESAARLTHKRDNGHPMPTQDSLTGMGERLKEKFDHEIDDDGEGKQLFTLLSIRNAELVFNEFLARRKAA